jgi:hypothetical protein
MPSCRNDANYEWLYRMSDKLDYSMLRGVGVIALMVLPYKYHDCLKVGHSKTYCALHTGE